MNETVSSGENRIPLFSILGIERKEGNRYVERILSLLRAAIGTRSSEGLKNSITRYESMTGIEPKLRGAHTPAETETNDDIVCTQPARWPAAPIYFLAVVTNDWQLSMLSLAYQQHRPENRQIRGETGTSKRELAIVHTRVDPSHDYSLSAVQRLHGPPFSTAQTLR